MLSTKFNQLMCVSRFAHYLKVMARNRIGSFMERGDMEKWLNSWINNYALGNPETASEQDKASKPLAWAEIKVQDVPGSPVRTGRWPTCGRTSSWNRSTSRCGWSRNSSDRDKPSG